VATLPPNCILSPTYPTATNQSAGRLLRLSGRRAELPFSGPPARPSWQPADRTPPHHGPVRAARRWAVTKPGRSGGRAAQDFHTIKPVIQPGAWLVLAGTGQPAALAGPARTDSEGQLDVGSPSPPSPGSVIAIRVALPISFIFSSKP